MTLNEQLRVAWHLSIPVCRTMHGARIHLAAINCEELRLLCNYHNCSAEEITKEFWQKMTLNEQLRVAWHLSMPVCRTMHGSRIHLAAINCEELRLLCNYHNCSAEEITKEFWQSSRSWKEKLGKIKNI